MFGCEWGFIDVDITVEVDVDVDDDVDVDVDVDVYANVDFHEATSNISYVKKSWHQHSKAQPELKMMSKYLVAVTIGVVSRTQRLSFKNCRNIYTAENNDKFN